MGHKRTIRPNARKLSALFQARNKMDWDTFSRKVKSCQSGFMGEPEEVRPGHGEFHEYPSSCICKTPFNHSNFREKYNNHTSSVNPSLLDSRYEYIHNISDLDEKILQKLYQWRNFDRTDKDIIIRDPQDPENQFNCKDATRHGLEPCHAKAILFIFGGGQRGRNILPEVSDLCAKCTLATSLQNE